ncbi:MAG: hypothetical protein C3F13_02740 [Anaerolineales bacterium]|nr:MAG: hypothetical protein C3F13_02740 [Anaerolineales bacterium]
MMHSNLSITDGVYGTLSDNDVKGQITTLGLRKDFSEVRNIEELTDIIRKLVERWGVDHV